ncbi:MAG: class II glutamine amidotransferase, partial [Chloroflexi bacterium]|nr:class II glutamine amidotransferase [Chloroflexota bacterium]
MCGIIGIVGNEPAAPLLLDGLRKLEYRGYDSAGAATVSGGRLHFAKGIGKLEDVETKHSLAGLPGNVGIGHVRWATHGGVTVANAHPHFDCTGRIAVVHNGIIENYGELRAELEKTHVFVSETDTEVIPHLIEEYVKKRASLEEAVV